jgi:hypothetical protein
MGSLTDFIGGGDMMPAAMPLTRRRQKTAPDPMNPAQTIATGENDDLNFTGFIASNSSTQTTDGARDTTLSSAVLTVANPSVDICKGDTILDPADSQRKWEVTGFPSHEANPFTGWNPTFECTLEEVKG